MEPILVLGFRLKLVLLLIEGREETSKTDDLFFSTLSCIIVKSLKPLE